MIPVAEEHVEEAMQAVLRIASRARQTPWDQELVSRLFHSVDEPTRSVLSTVARAARHGPVGAEKVADTIEYPQREVLGIIREVNEQVQNDGHPPMLVTKLDTEVLPNGRTREARLLMMDSEVAAFVTAAEQEEAAAAPPLLGGAG